MYQSQTFSRQAYRYLYCLYNLEAGNSGVCSVEISSVSFCDSIIRFYVGYVLIVRFF